VRYALTVQSVWVTVSIIIIVACCTSYALRLLALLMRDIPTGFDFEVVRPVVKQFVVYFLYSMGSFVCMLLCVKIIGGAWLPSTVWRYWLLMTLLLAHGQAHRWIGSGEERDKIKERLGRSFERRELEEAHYSRVLASSAEALRVSIQARNASIQAPPQPPLHPTVVPNGSLGPVMIPYAMHPDCNCTCHHSGFGTTECNKFSCPSCEELGRTPPTPTPKAKVNSAEIQEFTRKERDVL
jgi:hypothetical protein